MKSWCISSGGQLQDNICCGSAAPLRAATLPWACGKAAGKSTGGSAAGVGPTRPCLLPIRARAESYGVSFPNSTAPQRPGPERSPSSTPTLALGATPQGLPLPAPLLCPPVRGPPRPGGARTSCPWRGIEFDSGSHSAAWACSRRSSRGIQLAEPMVAMRLERAHAQPPQPGPEPGGSELRPGRRSGDRDA